MWHIISYFFCDFHIYVLKRFINFKVMFLEKLYFSHTLIYFKIRNENQNVHENQNYMPCKFLKIFISKFISK